MQQTLAKLLPFSSSWGNRYKRHILVIRESQRRLTKTQTIVKELGKFDNRWMLKGL